MNRTNRIADRIELGAMIGKVAFVLAQLIASMTLATEPATPAAKTAVSDATVETRKNSQPELPDSLDRSGSGRNPEGQALEEQPAAVRDDQLSGPQEAGTASVSPRPVVFLYTSPHCSAGDQMRAALARGEFEAVGLDVREIPPPPWYVLCPTFHWTADDGKSYIYPRNAESFDGIAGLLRAFDEHSPGARLKATSVGPVASPANVAAPKSAADQLWKFLPPGTRITIEPPQPVKATLEDGTIVSYPRIVGVLGQQNGNPGIKLDPPLPQVSARKFFLRFGATISGAEYEAAGPAGVGVVTIETSRGKFRMKLEEVP